MTQPSCRILFSAWMIAICLFSSASLAAETPAAPTQHLQQVKDNIADLRKDLQQQQSNRQQLQQNLQAAEVNLSTLNQQQQQTQQQLQQQQTALQTLAQQQKQNQVDLQRQQQQLLQQIRTAYVLGNENYFKVLLNQEDPQLLSRNMMYYQYVIRSRQQLIAQITSNRQQMQQNQQDIAQRKQQLAQLQTQQTQQIAKVKNAQAGRQQALSQINLTISSKDQRLHALLADEQALEQVMKRLDQQSAKAAPAKPAPTPSPPKKIESKTASSTTPIPATPVQETLPSNFQQPSSINFAQAQGKLPWPTKGKISMGFNSRIEQSELKLNGVVINASQGQKVYAVAPGRVAFAQWMSGYGLLLIIDHGQGYMSLYGRNGSLYKKVGDVVKGGEQIATVGDSGGYSQSGLYFAIREQGTPLDPSHWCRRG